MPSIVAIGDINIDWSVDVADINAPIAALWRESATSIVTSLGGGGAIFAVAAKDVGFESRLVGRVGADVFGRYALEELGAKGIDLLVSRDAHAETGKVFIARDCRDRKAMISHRGANVLLSPDEIDAAAVRSSDLLYVSGYALLERPQSLACLDAVRIARSDGVRVVLDVVPHRVVRDGLSRDYCECLDLAHGLVLELGTARRLLVSPEVSEDAARGMLLEKHSFVVLRPDNDTQIVATPSRTVRMTTGYSQAAQRLGYLDRFIARTLRQFLEGQFD